MIVACRAYGLRSDQRPLRRLLRPGWASETALGGRPRWAVREWAIHPEQVALANEVFTPLEAEVCRARRIIEALREAEAEGRNATSLDAR